MIKLLLYYIRYIKNYFNQREEVKIGLISKEDAKYLQEQFSGFKNSVNIYYFNSEKTNADFCKLTNSILEELTALSPKINLKSFDFENAQDTVKEYNIMKPPALSIQQGSDLGIRYYGIPSGYEFSTIINTITMIGMGNTDIQDIVREKTKLINKKTNIMVFVTPPCPYCPRAATLAHKFAYMNENIESAVIEANEFPVLSREFNVMAVPKIVINKKHSFEGAYPPERFIDEVIKGIS
ncbi:MAG: hypothetical protein B5M53_11720 [Candidatus Cloacimonas sp. 4484_209]|nr:MAG: hypothetical protein B5M53_11720 [Candidatus Cloacimonas sp. 4484_209]